VLFLFVFIWNPNFFSNHISPGSLFLAIPFHTPTGGYSGAHTHPHTHVCAFVCNVSHTIGIDKHTHTPTFPCRPPPLPGHTPPFLPKSACMRIHIFMHIYAHTCIGASPPSVSLF
jgi:hypothetical protein